MQEDTRYFLEQALQEARKAEANGQIPVGCVIADNNNEIIAREYNRVNAKKDRSAHAEMLAIQAAIAKYTTENSSNWTVYTTLEPCVMCLGTIIMCNIGKVVWASPDRHIDTHQILNATPYLKTRRLVTIANPFPDLEQICSQLHDDYWTKIGRPDVVSPVTLTGNNHDPNS